jgi:preprotein translocase subunit YajC
MNNVWILAQAEPNEMPSKISSAPLTSEGEAITTVPSDSNTVATRREPPKPFFPPWLLLALAVICILMIFRGPRKKQQEHKKMLQSLKKNDKVRTIGGILGTIVDIKDDEITLKIDESNNTKIKVISSAIGKNLSNEKL